MPHSRCPKARSRLFLRHIRKFDVLASVRDRDPRISQACKILTLLRVVRFFCKRCALSGRFPRGLTFGSHLISPRVGPFALSAAMLRSRPGKRDSLFVVGTLTVTYRCCDRQHFLICSESGDVTKRLTSGINQHCPTIAIDRNRPLDTHVCRSGSISIRRRKSKCARGGYSLPCRALNAPR